MSSAIVLLLALALAVPATSAAALSPGLATNQTLTHEGVTRLYDVLVPASYDGSQPVSLLIDIHGITDGKTRQRGWSGFAALAQTHGFVVAYPQGRFGHPGPEDANGSIFVDPEAVSGPSWNAGDWCCGDASDQAVDDVGFIRALVAAISAEASIDPRRIYVTGISNGGFLTHRLACEAADLFAAAAAFSANGPLQSCTPSRPIPILSVVGTTDQLIPYAGGHVVFGNPANPAVASAAQGLEAWRSADACTSASPDVTEATGASSQCVRFTSCAEAVEVGLCSVEGSPALWGHVLYAPHTTDGFDTAPYAWSFLSRFALGCGDLQIGAGEQCDDGNRENDDGCSSACQLEVAPTPVPLTAWWPAVALGLALLAVGASTFRRRAQSSEGRRGCTTRR